MKILLSLLKPTLLLSLVWGVPILSQAQYDGSFNDFYFNRSASAKSAAMGRSSIAVADNAFSVHTNSALLGFRDGFAASFSHSSPYYLGETARFYYYGISGRLLDNLALGLSRRSFDTGNTRRQRLTTIAFVFKPLDQLSVGANIRRFYTDEGRINDVSGRLKDATTSQDYFDLTAAFWVPYSGPSTEKASLTMAAAYENISHRSIDFGFGIRELEVELPAIITVGVSNKLIWKGPTEFYPFKNISLTLTAEYLNVTEYAYHSRFSFGTEVGLNDILLIRGGYFEHTNNDYGNPGNKSVVSDFTFGVGADIPVSQLLALAPNITLGMDYLKKQQPLFTNENPFNIGSFSTVSISLQVTL